MSTPDALNLRLQQLQTFGRQHRLSILATAVSLMAGFAITAVAVAPMLPDPALLPQRLIVEELHPEGVNAQLEALADQNLSLSRSDVTRATDSAPSLLARLGVQDAAAAQFLRTDTTARQILAGRGGKMVQARTDAQGRLQELVARFPGERGDRARSHFTRISLRLSGGHWTAQMDAVAYGTQARLASGTIRQSLFAATDEAGLPDSIAGQLAEIFAGDIDFHRDLRRGDTFSIVYEGLTADGEPVAWNDGAGRVLAAEFVNAGRPHQAVWFAGADNRGGYFGPHGESRRRVFLASPMAFSRITSGFAMRLHPILQHMRAHVGVDYGAPVGTPVRSVGDGVVSFAGWQNGYGKVVLVDHNNQRSTKYAHLSRIDVTRNQRVTQGQYLGAVGMTGLATGPHLHFEFLVNGVHQDPARVARAAETVPLDPASLPKFAETARAVQAKLTLADSMNGSRPSIE